MEKYNTSKLEESKEYASVIKSLTEIIAQKNLEIDSLRTRLEGANNSIQYWYKKNDELEKKLKEMTGEDEQEPEYNDKSEESD